MTGPLDGIRVVDLSSVLSGPIAAGVLADQGADVVKVEPPGVADVTLKVGASRNGMTAMYHLANRGKRGVMLDLGSEGGRAVFRRLVDRADVLIQNFRPGVAERLGVAYDDLRATNPTLVYLSITGFGPSGPLSQLKVYDNMIQAVSGFASVQGGQAGEPTCVRNLICDKITAWMGAQAVTAALLARHRTGAGSHVQISMLDAAVSFLWTDAATSYTLLGDGIRDAPSVGGADLTRHVDGWSTAVPATDDEFRGFCHAYGHPEVAGDPRFATQAGRLGNPEYRRVYREVLQAAAAKLTVQEALTRLETAGVAAVAVVDLGQVPLHPQAVANHTFVEHDDPVAGRLRQPRPAARFGGASGGTGPSGASAATGPSATTSNPPGPAPTPGQHTDEVLSELGYSREEMAALRAEGTLG